MDIIRLEELINKAAIDRAKRSKRKAKVVVKHDDIELPPKKPRKKWNTPKHWNKQFKAKYVSYVSRIKEKGKEFTLSFEDFEDYFNKPCVYCGDNQDITIDRINSDFGYTKDNCQSCCLNCNVLKYYLPEDVFLNQIVKIVRFRDLLKLGISSKILPV